MNTKLEEISNNVLVIALPVAIAGALFKMMHFNGSNILLLVGLGSIVMASAIKYFFLKTIDGFVTGAAIVLGCLAVLFKLLHWPNSELLIKLAIAGGIVYGINTLKGIFFPVKEEE